MRGRGHAAMFGLMAIAIGCAPLAMQQGARTVGAGKTEIGSAYGLTAGQSQTKNGGVVTSKDASSGTMQPQAWVRHGFGSNLDLGVTVFGGGVRGEAKFAPIRTDGFCLAIDAGAGGSYGAGDDPSAGQHIVDSSHFFDAGVLGTLGAGSTDINFGARGMQLQVHSHSNLGGSSSSDSTTITNLVGGFASITLKGKSMNITPEIAVWSTSSEDKSVGDKTTGLTVVPSVGISTSF